MSLKKPVNENYCANVVEIKNLIDLSNCDNVRHTNIYGNLVIIGKDVKVGDIGIYFPVETELSKEFLSNNNLYRDNTLNVDTTKKGYFEVNGRIKALKFRGNNSAGFFIPTSSLDFTKHKEDLVIGSSFDEINNIPICKKYIVVNKNIQSNISKQQKVKAKSKSIEIVENQFRLHYDTAQLGKNINRVNENSLISITNKRHGTSGVSSYILCKRKLNLIEKILQKLGVKINDSEYRNIYSSRKVIKNVIESKDKKGFYDTDIWGIANNEVKDYLQKGMTFYYEILGYLPTGSYIQSGYDYGCEVGKHRVEIYRITYTNIDGVVYEFSAKQVQDFCKSNGLNAVPELYYGIAKDLNIQIHAKLFPNGKEYIKFDSGRFLDFLNREYLEKDLTCNISCKVPDEGIVLKIEGYEQEVYKLKSYAFYERETKLMDKGESDLESDN